MNYNENAIRAAEKAAKAWLMAARAMSAAKLAATLHTPDNVAIVATGAKEAADLALEAYKAANCCCEAAFGSDTYEAAEAATAAARDAKDVARNAANFTANSGIVQ